MSENSWEPDEAALRNVGRNVARHRYRDALARIATAASSDDMAITRLHIIREVVEKVTATVQAEPESDERASRVRRRLADVLAGGGITVHLGVDDVEWLLASRASTCPTLRFEIVRAIWDAWTERGFRGESAADAVGRIADAVMALVQDAA